MNPQRRTTVYTNDCLLLTYPMKNIIITLNGKIVTGKEASIPINSEAFLFGYAVFETLRTYHGKLFRIEEHLKRLKESAHITGFTSPWTDEQIEAQMHAIMNNIPWVESKMRIILTKEDLIVMLEPLHEKDPWMYEKGIKLSQYNGQRTLPLAKNLADILCYSAKSHAAKEGAYDAILVDSHGIVRECAYANIFWVKKDQLFTNEKEVLHGITRQTVIEVAGNCHFSDISFKDLLNTDEIFITQSSSGILPVVEVDGKLIRKGQPGPVTKELMKAFREKVWGSK